MDEQLRSKLDYNKILQSLADHAATSLGKQAAHALKPTTDMKEIMYRLQTTDEAIQVERLQGTIPLAGVVDIQAAVNRARIQAILQAKELRDISTLLWTGRKIKRHIDNVHSNTPIPLLHQLVWSISEQKQLEDEIRHCIDEQGTVLDQASFELVNVRRKIKLTEIHIRHKLETIMQSMNSANMLQEALITIRNQRYVIPVKSEYRNYDRGIIHDQSSSGATVFMEPAAIVALNNKLQATQLEEEREVERILSRLTEQVNRQSESLLHDIECIKQLDFIFAKSKLANQMQAKMPQINDQRYMKLNQARHPLITSEQVVPIDIELGHDYTTIIITGPNTGGKTVTLKTIGLLSLMAMSGLFIPAKEDSEVCIFDSIYADIGDEQSIEQSLSTFSSHLTNIIHILQRITSKSLVLLDEVGVGTDPAEGSALSRAILDHIHNINCCTVATTHYGELKAYAYERAGIMNASMEFDVQTFRPTYRLLLGMPGRSHAFAIAEQLGLPASIIVEARNQVKVEHVQIEKMLASLEENYLQAKADKQVAQQLRAEVEQLRKSLLAEQAKLQAEQDKRIDCATEKAREIICKAKEEANTVIYQLKQLAQQEVYVKDHVFTEARKRLDEAVPANKQVISGINHNQQIQNIQVGDYVMVNSLNQKGTVIQLLDKETIVQLGTMKMKVQLTNLSKLSTQKQTSPLGQANSSVKQICGNHTRSELDLRGENLEDALIKVDRFLAAALLANFGQVYIIHGKGTGILRTGIQNFLRKHKYVKIFRTGNYNEGGTGITVAELK